MTMMTVASAVAVVAGDYFLDLVVLKYLDLYNVTDGLQLLHYVHSLVAYNQYDRFHHHLGSIVAVVVVYRTFDNLQNVIDKLVLWVRRWLSIHMAFQNSPNTMVESNFAPYFPYMNHNDMPLIHFDFHTEDDDDCDYDDDDDDVAMDLSTTRLAVLLLLMDVADDEAASHSN